MQNGKTLHPKFDHDEYARTCAPDDFLGQTRRTVQGKPVSEDQVNLIISTIKSKLELSGNDKLLELACGNGYLSRLLFDSCTEYMGVDLSEFLVSVAKNNFEKLPNYRFAVQAAVEYVRQEQQPEKFTKALCYASFSYFSASEASEVLRTLFEKFSNVQTVLIGNLPDKDRAMKFYKDRQPSAEELSDCSTAIGTWRTQSEFAQLAADAGWKVKISTMPPEFFGAYYRYDALLSR